MKKSKMNTGKSTFWWLGITVFLLAIIAWNSFSDTKNATLPVDRTVKKSETSAEKKNSSPQEIKQAQKPQVNAPKEENEKGDIQPINTEEYVSEPAVNSRTVASLEETGATLENASGSNVTTYWNESLKYGFAVPKGDYYMGGGSRDGAAHSVGIKTGTGASDFESSDVKVWFYPKTILPELGERSNGFTQDPTTNTTYLLLGSGSLKIEGDINGETVNTIISTINRK